MLDDFLRHTLDDLDSRQLRRRLRVSSSKTGLEFDFDQRRLHNFASNDYLGLAAHPKVVAAALEATRRYGAGTGASRTTG